MVFAGREGKVCHALGVKFIPGIAQVVGLEELHFICYSACAELLVGRVLQVPARLRLLYVLANDSSLLGSLGLIWHGPPDLQVLDGVAIRVL